MIYTVTLNPAIDYVIRADELKIGEINRTSSENIFFGGKGINVSFILSELGIKSTAFGFVAGFTGDAIEKGVKEKGIEADFVRVVTGFTRINVKINSVFETEINGRGPIIDEYALRMFFMKLEKIKSGDTLILAGSVPGSLPSDMYERILSMLSHKGIRVIVDASGELLLNVLKYNPFLIKPNIHELGELFDTKVETTEQVTFYASKLQEMGAKNVLVSMGADGAILLDEDGVFHSCDACKGEVKNTVGAGDSMVAGFIAGYESGGYEHALKLGTACGSATAFSDGLAHKFAIARYMHELTNSKPW